MINPVNRNINKDLIERLNESFNGQPWYGRSLISILRLTEELPTRALEILSHMIAWRLFVNNALNGIEEKIELNTPEDWPPVIQSQQEILQSLENSQQLLIESINDFDPNRWYSKPADAKYSYIQLCEGIKEHDIYHSAQIASAISQSR